MLVQFFQSFKSSANFVCFNFVDFKVLFNMRCFFMDVVYHTECIIELSLNIMEWIEMIAILCLLIIVIEDISGIYELVVSVHVDSISWIATKGIASNHRKIQHFIHFVNSQMCSYCLEAVPVTTVTGTTRVEVGVISLFQGHSKFCFLYQFVHCNVSTSLLSFSTLGALSTFHVCLPSG
jgi:hypothetical protein